MLRPRVSPCLLLEGDGLVKTVQFRNPTYVGDPINAVKIFNEKEADELIVLDIEATEKGRVPDLQLIQHLAVECRMPLCYGGGIKTAEQARAIIAAGVEKVAIGSGAVEDPGLVPSIAREIGSQSVVVVLDAKRRAPGREHEVWTRRGQRCTGRTVVEWAREAERMGAGEVLVNSIDDDGRMKGYDLALARSVREATALPMTVLGGAGSLADLAKLFDACGVVGAAAGSLFVFKGTYRAVLISYPTHAQKRELMRMPPDR